MTAVACLTMAMACDAAVEEPTKVDNFEAFRLKTPYEPELKRYYVEGDIGLDEAELRSYYDRRIKAVKQGEGLVPGDEARESKLLVGATIDADIRWSSAEAMALTYCVSSDFGATDANNVVNAMAGANLSWANSALVNFVHLAAEDSNCNAANNNVLFDVRPFMFADRTLASAFFPNDPRPTRSLLVSPAALSGGFLQAILSHELGHILGFRHENNRTGPNPATEDTCGWEAPDFRALTAQDGASIMNCQIGFGASVSFSDRTGAACLYGATPNFTPTCSVKGLLYDTHVQGIGWLPLVRDNDISGTIGQSRRLEAVRLFVAGLPGVGICYSAHVQDVGWQPEKCNFGEAGTTGLGLRMEAIKIRLVNPPANCSVVYQAHVQDQGWQGQVMDNQVAGTQGQSLRMEAIKVGLTPPCFF